jgi:hypothetical protein
MQTIYIDISKKGIIQTINAKQGDIGRRFEILLFENGVPYHPVGDETNLSLWYCCEGFCGNYRQISVKNGSAEYKRLAFTADENSVIVELAPQMLEEPGIGQMCLSIDGDDGETIGTWNIQYEVEGIPGYPSKEPSPYYPRFVLSVNGVVPDESGNVEVAGGGGGGVSDWNDLANRPFYENEDGTVAKQLDDKYLKMLELTEKDIFPEQDVAFVYAENFNCFASAFPNGTFVLTDGAEYKVLWEETVYTCTAFYIESMGATAIGNTVAIGGEDNGIPFAIGSDSNGGVTIFSFDQTTKKVRIYQSEGYKIKESYIPDSLYAQIDKRIEDYINAALGGDY